MQCFDDLNISMRRRDRGFSLMELLLVVAIIMLVASIMIPKLIDAIHKAKQRKTMAELNSVGTAWMSWLTDQVGAASAGTAKTYNTEGFVAVDYPEMVSYLRPSNTFFYMDSVPEQDGWGSALNYYRNTDLADERQLMICASARDGVFDVCDISEPLPIGPFLATDFDQDIIWADGMLLRWPEIASGGN